MGAIAWMGSLAVSQWIETGDWGFPVMLVLHTIGLASAVGIFVMLDLRVLGFARIVPLVAFRQLMGVAWIGFIINAISGTLMFMADAEHLLVNWSYWSKMSCVLLGVIISAVLWRRLRSVGAAAATSHREAVVGYSAVGAGALSVAAAPVTETGSSEALAVDGTARMLAVVSIALWLGAILFGRLIAYVMDAQILRSGNF